jgi:glutaredoxin
MGKEKSDAGIKWVSCLFLLLCLALAGPIVAGELFKWVDDQGNVHYGDKPPENASLKRIEGNISSYGSVSVEPFVAAPGKASAQAGARKVVMYSTSWCGFCKKAARHFRKNKIPFSEYDIEKSARAANEFEKLRARGVPVILIGKQRMNGFDAATFDRIYYGKT